MSPHTKTGLLAFGIVGGVFLVVALAVGALVLANRPGGLAGVSGPGPGGSAPTAAVPLVRPRAEKQGADWTLRELADYLEANGVRFTSPTTDRVGDHLSLTGWDDAGNHGGIKQFKDARAARDEAGASRNGFAWGRFAIFLSDGPRERARKLLAD